MFAYNLFKSNLAAFPAEPDFVQVVNEHEAESDADSRDVNYPTHERSEQCTTDDACVDDTCSGLCVRTKFLKAEVEDEWPHH